MVHGTCRLAGALMVAGLPAAALSAPPPIRPPAEAMAVALTLRADRPGPVVNRNFYGHFAEHLGRCVVGRVLTAPAINSHNAFTAPDAVRPTELREVRLGSGVVEATLPARSVVVLELR
jgi:alpha-L-arabinofuranosidase